MKSLVEYMIGRELMLAESHRIRTKIYTTKKMEFHYGDWVSVETKNHTRLVDSQLLMRFFIHSHRLMDFGEMIERLAIAISKLGTFESSILNMLMEDIFSFFHSLSLKISKLSKYQFLSFIQITKK